MAEKKLLERMVSFRDKVDDSLQEPNFLNDTLGWLESKTGVRRVYFTVGAVILFSLYLMFGYGTDFLCCLTGFVYPAYCSIKAIESDEKDDDTKWLTYWVVYSIIQLTETFSDFLFFWIPCYDFFKTLFLGYCFHPGDSNGSVRIYNNIICPLVFSYRKISREDGEEGSKTD